MRGLAYQTLQLPFAAGLNQKVDARARQAPSLDLAKDIQFDELGGVQTRKPCAPMRNDIAGGGVLANVRGGYAAGDELLVFTKDTLYSYNDARGVWVPKGTHLATKLTEQSVFVGTGDQLDADRAELGGSVFYAWTDNAKVYVAVLDSVTGSVQVAPTVLAGVAERPRLVALDTKVLLIWHNGTTGAPASLLALAMDPADPATAIAAGGTSVIAAPDFNLYYDAIKVPGADVAIVAARRSVTTSYTVARVTAAIGVTTAVKARTCDGPIAVSCPSTGASVQIVRANGTNIQGDLLVVATLADTFTAQAIGTAAGTPVNQIAAAHSSVLAGGQYRCFVFWSSQEAVNAGGGAGWQSKSNWVDTGGALGAQAVFVRVLGIASRAFDYDGRVYVWGAFAGESGFAGSGVPGFRAQLQNAYFLYRDDGFLVAKAAYARGGGFSASIGHLPHVAQVAAATYAWAGIERRIIDTGGNHQAYGKRAPRDIRIAFDSNEARRCARLGQTVYLTGGELLQYDGVQLTEVGYHVYPWYFGAIEAAGGAVPNGTYAIKVTERWENAKGELDRSTTATVGQVTLVAGPSKIQISNWPGLFITHKLASAVAMEIWRTAVNPTDEAPFYLVTSKDPTAAVNPNRYIANDATVAGLPTFEDALTDIDLLTKEEDPGNVGVLENLAPPAATIVIATDTRLFLAGVAGDPNRVWYSKLRNDGEVAAFFDVNAFDVPIAGGAITALALLNETLIVFRERAIYAVTGDGYDNTGGNQNYGPPRLLSADVGAVSHQAVALSPAGLVFKSSKGWYLLNRGWAVDYIGGPVSAYDTDTVVAVHVVERQHQVRCLTTARMLVLDYSVRSEDSPMGQWAEWTIADGLGATMWRGTYVYFTSSGPATEQDTFAATTYGLDVETPWIKPADLQGACRVRWLEILGELRSVCHLRVRMARDYQYDAPGVPSYFYDDYVVPSPGTIGSALQVRISPTEQRCESFKVRITAVSAADHNAAPAGEAVKLTGLGLEVGVDRGLFRRLPAAQSQ